MTEAQTRLYYCDCCDQPMVNVSRFGPNRSAAGCDTSACLLCLMFPPSKEDLLEEIEALGEHMNEDKVAERIIQLADAMGRK